MLQTIHITRTANLTLLLTVKKSRWKILNMHDYHANSQLTTADSSRMKILINHFFNVLIATALKQIFKECCSKFT